MHNKTASRDFCNYKVKKKLMNVISEYYVCIQSIMYTQGTVNKFFLRQKQLCKGKKLNTKFNIVLQHIIYLISLTFI